MPIKESQSSFQRFKICIEISPSVTCTLFKNAKGSANGRHRETCFKARTDRVKTPQSSSGKEVDECLLSFIYLQCVCMCAQPRVVQHTCNNKFNSQGTNFLIYKIADQISL